MNDGGLKRCDASGKTFHTGLKKILPRLAGQYLKTFY